MKIVPMLVGLVGGIGLVACSNPLRGNAVAASEAGRTCSQCGCAASCRKVCRLKCEEKKISVTVWSSKSEEVCIPGPSAREGKQCEEEEFQSPDSDCPESLKQRMVWWQWLPKSAPTLHEQHKLMKKTVTKTVPSYRWVVEDLCPECAKSKK